MANSGPPGADASTCRQGAFARDLGLPIQTALGSVTGVMSKHLEGKVAIVTGGAGGMGSQICRTFAAQGAKVVVADTGADVEGRMGADPSRVNAVVEAITRAGGEAVSSVGDVATMDYAESLIRLALETAGSTSSSARTASCASG